MRTRITQLDPEDPRNRVGIAGAAISPEHVAAIRHILFGLQGDYPKVAELLRSTGIPDPDLNRWIEAGVKGAAEFISLTEPRHDRLPFLIVASLVDQRSMDDRIRQPIDGEERGR